MQAAGGTVRNLDGSAVMFNQRKLRLPGLIAAGPNLYPEISRLLNIRTETAMRPSAAG